MSDNTALLALGGIAAAALLAGVLGRDGGSTAAPSVSRDQVFSGQSGNTQPSVSALLDHYVETAQRTTTGSTSNSSREQGFAEQIVNRTGYLPSGFDAAGRVAQINSGETVGL